MGSIGGQSSGDFKLGQGALRIVYSMQKDSIPVLSADSFTQNNPPIITAAAERSTTLPTNVKRGVLGGSVAFTRPDIGANTVGGPVLSNTSYIVNIRPLGLFINDALGNSYENIPGVASGKGPFVRGGCVGDKIYETQVQTAGAGTPGAPITYLVGQKVYASVNGLLTNLWKDSYEYQWINGVSGSGALNAAIEPDITCMGIVISPDPTGGEMYLELKY